MSTGRVCDGYPSLFRIFGPGGSQPSSTSAPAANPELSLSLYQPRPSVITADEVDRLAHYFHRRRRVSVCYQNEARAILENLSDPAIRHALNSLSALHDGPEETRYPAGGGGRGARARAGRGRGAGGAAGAGL